jgi:serine phosphatase RsbU (regulator of sigma subunit)
MLPFLSQMDIIDFAEQIQKAILPSSKEMGAALAEYFIFHKSLERLSGDIYWFTQRGDKIFVAVVDCTGHGMGGALLSMFGNWTLDKLVKERHLCDPALILQGLHSEVRYTGGIGLRFGGFWAKK